MIDLVTKKYRMKTLLLAATVLIIAMTACNEKKSKVTIIGSWIMPIDGQPGKMQGIRLDEDGEASSINMATLVYKYWEQQGDELYLTVKSIGNGVEIEGIDTLKIEKLTTDSLVLNSNYGYTLRYAKEKSTKP
ncbi:hypothetical protein BACEGG_02686 [Bacteroides eggerthii DSM 20697]|jgi:hypothetical protein|nr:hypothetical protein BACEGG_02686 [Bacteroides eggerthii DSM 20697]